MVLYNITFKVEDNSAESWLQFMKDDYLPLLFKTGYILNYSILKLLNEEYSDGGTTYSVQLMLENTEQLQRYQEVYEVPLEANLHKKFGGTFLYFKTWLEEVVNSRDVSLETQ